MRPGLHLAHGIHLSTAGRRLTIGLALAEQRVQFHAVMLLPSAPPPWLVGWIALAASAVSLIISGATFFLTQRRPNIRLVLPLRLRLAVHPKGDAWLYMQPILVNVGRSTRADVLDDIRLELTEPNGTSRHLEYIETSKTVWDSERREVHVEYAHEAAPVIVAQNAVRSDMLTFKTTTQSSFAAGKYSGILYARSVASSKLLQARFTVIIEEHHVSTWRESDGRRFAMLSVARQ